MMPGQTADETIGQRNARSNAQLNAPSTLNPKHIVKCTVKTHSQIERRNMANRMVKRTVKQMVWRPPPHSHCISRAQNKGYDLLGPPEPLIKGLLRVFVVLGVLLPLPLQLVPLVRDLGRLFHHLSTARVHHTRGSRSNQSKIEECDGAVHAMQPQIQWVGGLRGVEPVLAAGARGCSLDRCILSPFKQVSS